MRFYHYLDPASINSTILFPFVEEFFTSVLKDDEGLVTYYSAANVPEGNEAVVLDIFETEEQVIASNEKAANYTNPDWPATSSLLESKEKFHLTTHVLLETFPTNLLVQLPLMLHLLPSVQVFQALLLLPFSWCFGMYFENCVELSG